MRVQVVWAYDTIVLMWGQQRGYALTLMNTMSFEGFYFWTRAVGQIKARGSSELVFYLTTKSCSYWILNSKLSKQ